ncbi:MAG TPA: hypothetical protein VES88_15180 [Gemmatimonadaceae bacterium]|nr:hypothetical protein [Gemmatimonadaceae bacterium]
MAINTQKVFVGGFVAGVILNIVDYLGNGVILADRMKADTEAFKPGLSDMMMEGNAIAMYVISDLVIGLLLVWTYAAMRPRFGPGPRTAVHAALLFWIISAIVAAGYLHMGAMSAATWWMYACFWLVGLLVAAIVGGKLYTEEGSAAAA